MGNTCKFKNINDLEIRYESNEKLGKESDESSDKISDSKADDNINEFQEIKEYRKIISQMNLFMRKEIAKKEYELFLKNDKYINEDNNEKIKTKYIKIMCLLLIDNTNKDIVRLYLNFIKVNSLFIKENKLLTYDMELEKYKIIFTIEEMEKIQKNKKKKSQKKIFFDYINYLYSKISGRFDIEVAKSIKDFAIKKLQKLFLFNTPIEFDNEELIYYKCYYNIIYDIAKYNGINIKKYFINKKNVIEFILKKDLYNNENINTNEDKMNFLSLLLMKEKFKEKSDKEEGTLNFIRLMQKIPVTVEELQKYNEKDKNKNNSLVNEGGDYYIQHIYKQIKKEEVSFLISLDNSCIHSLFNPRLEFKGDTKLFYNLDALMDNNELSPYISKIKQFLKKIVDKNVYKQAIKQLFPEYYRSLTSNNNEEIKEYIDKRIKFYPFQKLNISGITDKLSCYSFIPSINFLFEEYSNISNQNKETCKIGLTIVNSLHEINHENQIILFFKGSNKGLINSPERIINENLSSKEGDFSLEYILFGDVISRINLFQCLYIMNEKNYDQELSQFRENFMKIQDIVIETKGETELIKIENGIFKKFYDNVIQDIKSLLSDLNDKTILAIPRIYIEKTNIIGDNKDYEPQKNCALFGGA